MNILGHQVGTIGVFVKEVRLPTGRRVGGCVCVYVCVVVSECANSAVCVYYFEPMLQEHALTLFRSSFHELK